jgi:hypothetical protein
MNQEEYQNVFSRLHASEQKVKEVIEMKEKRQIHRGFRKRALIIVCVVTLLFGSVVSVNAATDGLLWDQVKVWINGSELSISSAYQDENGSWWLELEEGAAEQANVNEMQYLQKDGKDYLVYQGMEYEMTDEMKQGDTYHVPVDGGYIDVTIKDGMVSFSGLK